MKRPSAFTLIELLVAVSIIALLVAILMPALNLARQQARAIPCLANQRALGLAFFMYQDDYNGGLVTGHAWFSPPTSVTQRRDWVYGPMDNNGVLRYDNPTVAFEKNGIRQGALWKYIQEEEAYHCPSDIREVRSNRGYRSYSMVAGIGAAYGQYVTTAREIHRMSELKQPSEKYIFVEEIEKTKTGECWWNMGSWVIDLSGQYWYDPVAKWHVQNCNLAFADGHSEGYRWQDQRTIDWIQGDAQKGSPRINHAVPQRNLDMLYMLRGFPHK